jgi:hypothetical protein
MHETIGFPFERSSEVSRGFRALVILNTAERPISLNECILLTMAGSNQP